MDDGWKRLKESEFKEYGSMLPARVVLDFQESDGTYRTFLETRDRESKLRFQYGRFFATGEEALEDFGTRVGGL